MGEGGEGGFKAQFGMNVQWVHRGLDFQGCRLLTVQAMFSGLYLADSRDLYRGCCSHNRGVIFF